MSYDEEQRVRRHIPERPDFHLDNWGRWRRQYKGVKAHAKHSLCVETLGGASSPDASIHVFEREAVNWACVADAVIEVMDPADRNLLSQVYESPVWIFRAGREAGLVAAATEFWKRAQRKGLT